MTTTTGEQSAERVRFIDLHRHPARRAYFASDRPGIAHDAMLGAWVVDDPALVSELLADERLAGVDVAKLVARAEAKGAKLENTRYLARYMPLWLEGEAHRERRRDVGRLLQQRRRDLLDALPGAVAARMRPLFIPGTVEVMSEVLAPLLDDIGAKLFGVDPSEFRVHQLSGVFDRVGVRRAERLDRQLGEARAAIRDKLGADAELEGPLLVLVLLSHDTLLGTLGESLHHVFIQAGGGPIDETAIPAWPPETGVPFVERETRVPLVVRGHHMPAGDMVRLMLQGLAYSPDPADNARMFGSGTHLCLGKPLAIEAWTLIAAELARLDRRVTVIDYAPRVSHNALTVPARLKVRVH